MLTGAREGSLSGIRRWFAAAMAQDLGVFILPGSEIARAHGLDILAAGLQKVSSPRHASVLLIVGDLPPALLDAASVIYAQMMRPRALFACGTKNISPLPSADVVVGLSQQELVEGVRQLRTLFRDASFRTDVSDFDAPALQVRIEYVCPMHPEVVQDEAGSCPKCGMNLMPREAQAHSIPSHANHQTTVDTESAMPMAHNHPSELVMGGDPTVEYTCPMHPEVVQNEAGSCPKCGMNLEVKTASTEDAHEHHQISHDVALEYTCPMHPEVVQNEAGSCPKCGMNLEVKTASTEDAHEHHQMSHDVALEYTCPMHPEVVQNEAGSCPKCGMNLEVKAASTEDAHEHHQMSHDVALEYTCPMHPEVVQNEAGSCPKCGMFLVPSDKPETPNHDHAAMSHTDADHGDMDGMDHADMGFMSMIDVTRDLPRSNDGLPMEWISAPFGPFFPGLPGGLLLTLSLDGDTVAGCEARSLFANIELLEHLPVDAVSFVDRLAEFNPAAAISYRLLACQALEAAAGVDVPTDIVNTRIGGLERERIASHLNWLALFGQQTGFDWLMKQAASLQLKIQYADIQQVILLQPDVITLIKRLQRTPLLKSRTLGIGQLKSDTHLLGPVARACGINDDVRATDNNFTRLGFTAASREQGDVFARLEIRLEEMLHSFALIKAAGNVAEPVAMNIGDSSGEAEVALETPRGKARLKLTLKQGQVMAAQLQTPSTPHLALVDTLIEQQTLTDALIAVASLDLSAWELRQ